MHWKSLQKKNSQKPNTATHNNARWYTDTDAFLENLPNEGSMYYKGLALQKIIPVFLGGPPHEKEDSPAASQGLDLDLR